MTHVVLYCPEIPQNTGNIARSCAATGARLHLVEPLGFSLSDKYLKRAGLDYWSMVDLHVHASFEVLLSELSGVPFFYASTKAAINYADVIYPCDCALVFGPETRGLPEEMLLHHYASAIRIPMLDGARSLNLSNSVAVVLFEALRQHGFPNMNARGTINL